MSRLEPERLSWLEETCQSYQAELGEEGLSYLHGRGLSGAAAAYFRLGRVIDPPAEHRRYAGMLAIPYVKVCGVVGFKFRCISPECKVNTEHEDHEGHPKFDSPAGQRIWLYNTGALLTPALEVHIPEGEPDTWMLWDKLDAACVGIPGADAWKKNRAWYRRLFRDVKQVYIWPDNDPDKFDDNGNLKPKAGARLTAQLVDDIPGAIVVDHQGKDATRTYLDYGLEALKEAVA